MVKRKRKCTSKEQCNTGAVREEETPQSRKGCTTAAMLRYKSKALLERVVYKTCGYVGKLGA